MFPLLIALIVFVVAGIAAGALLRKLADQPGDLKQGLAHLAELRWRDFARLVLQAMQARGYEIVRDDGAHADGLPTDGGDILLRNGSQRTLLSCKYGNASVVGAQSILGLGKSAQLRGAHSAIVVTPGAFDDEARRVAAQQHVELIDGATLWPQVKPFVNNGLGHEGAHAAAPAGRARNLAIAWGGAAALAAVAWMLAQGALQAPPVEAAVAAPAVAPAAKPAKVQAAPPASAAVPSDPAVLERRRSETARAISTVAGVDRALWSTQSTLLVYLASAQADPIAELCPLLERYPELAASRVQLQPPPGSDRPVRFKQCQAY